MQLTQVLIDHFSEIREGKVAKGTKARQVVVRGKNTDTKQLGEEGKRRWGRVPVI